MTAQMLFFNAFSKKDLRLNLMLLSKLWSLNCIKMHFLQFCAELIKKFKSVTAITYIHLKGLVMLFQKMVFFIML